MPLRLYDTLTRQKRDFSPIDPANVRMYVCGPTVYDHAHIGNARPVIVFDVLYRLLRHLYGEKHVTYVRNITDVDDKINARALRDFPGLPLNEAIRKVTETTYTQFQEDVTALGCLAPTHQPRATEFVLPRDDGKADMKSLIQELLDRDHAYVAIGAEGKEVLFDVTSMPDYGALSGRRVEDQKAGARVAVDPHKKNPGDFVLWKESGALQPGWKGEFEFVPDPRSGYDVEFRVSTENARELGRNSRIVGIHGRPGWHIECSAMAAAYLGDVFDIHGGGLDLIFPHHENEIAQSRCAHNTDVMANIWMHNGFLQVEGEKMSKSTGNFVTIKELLEQRTFGSNQWHGYVIRLAMFMTHYRQPIDWTIDRLVEARKSLKDWIDTVYGYEPKSLEPPQELIDLLADDLNSPSIVALLHRYNRDFHSHIKVEFAEKLSQSLRFLGIWNGEKTHEIYSYGYEVGSGPSSADIDRFVEFRTAARARKDFAESDRLRDELAAMGVVLKDGKDADGKPVTTWEIAR